MPEPGFDQLARDLLDAEQLEPSAASIAEQLRHVWNARGAAEQALIEKWRPMAVCYCSIHCDCDASGYETCIADLETLLGQRVP